MGQSNVDEVKLKVPRQEGHIIGDFLRKYAIRGSATWQIIGFVIGSTTPNFSLPSGAMSSYLELLKCELECSTTQAPGSPKICRFVWDGSAFTYGDMKIRGVSRGVGDSVTAILAHCNGTRSAKDNYELCKEAMGDNVDGVFAVPSRHTATTQFRFDVIPIDSKTEWLSIRAESEVVRAACDSAIKSLSGLGI